MGRAQCRRAALILLLALAAAGASSGCTTRVPIERPDSGRIKGRAVYVTTAEGTEYRFRWAEIQDSTLVGHYRIEEESTRDGEVEVVQSERTLPLKLSQITSIQTKRIDLSKTFFLAGGTAVLGYFIGTLLPDNSPAPPSNGHGGKPPPKK